MSHKTLTLILGACLCAAAPLASAAGWVSILKNTPAEEFGEEDIQLFLDSAKSALDDEGPAHERAWSNPASGAGGTFLELKRNSSSEADSACKRMRFTLHSRAVADQSSVWTLCKIDGRWRVKSGG